jgi:hypothetical protein
MNTQFSKVLNGGEGSLCAADTAELTDVDGGAPILRPGLPLPIPQPMPFPLPEPEPFPGPWL